MAEPTAVGIKILDISRISPPPGSVPTTSIPLTFFDLAWLDVSPVQRLFFYNFSFSTFHFTQKHLPLLKHTLSLALQHFFPYAARLMCPSSPHKPYISYTDGDSIPFTVAESSADFHHVVANYARGVTLLHPFVPQLPLARVTSDATRVCADLLALQITLFTDTGICIGTTYNHGAADGSVFMKFINLWASLNKSGGDSSYLDNKKSIPFFNRDVIKDPSGLEPILLNVYWNAVSSLSSTDHNGLGIALAHSLSKDKVRATFLMGRAHVEKIKNLVTNQSKSRIESGNSHVSTFVVTCAFMWVCLVKLKERFPDDASGDDSSNMLCYFLFAFDCRNLIVPGPLNHFGNCLMPGVVKVKRTELMGEDGIVKAARVIGTKVKEMKEGTLKDATMQLEGLMEMLRSGNQSVTVAGSPKLCVYDTDFGWGRPRKVEVTHIDNDGAISLAESRDEKGGIEMGVALSKSEMDQLICIYEESLKLL